MDAGTIVAIAAVLVVIGGGIWKFVERRFAKQQRDFEKTIADLQRDKEKLEQAADVDDKTIRELERQKDRLLITADLQDKFLTELPPKRRDRRGDSG
jgi:prefoldin subunit 5